MAFIATMDLMAVITAITLISEFAECYELTVIPYMLDTAEVKVYEWP